MVALVASTSIVLVPGAAAGTDDATGVVSEAEWILSAQCPDGAIANYPPTGTVQPYLGDFAALGLARAAQLTGDRRYSQGAWGWLAWYQARMDAAGFVNDYHNNGCALSDSGGRASADSTDSPAGLFLLALLAAHRGTAGASRLTEFPAGLNKAVHAIESTQDADGLTWARPGYSVKYLMDQAETFAGLAAAVDPAEALRDPATVARARRDLERMRAGVEMLWNPATGSYDWALHGNGFRETTKWPVLYPDALQQVWTVAFGLSTGDRARGIMERFGREQPNWSKPATTARFGSGPGRTGYWAPAGWAFLQTGASAEGRSAAASIRAASLAAGRAWPYTSGDAGQLILLESGDTGYLARAATPPVPSPALAPARGSRRREEGWLPVLGGVAGGLAILAGGLVRFGSRRRSPGS